MFTIAKTFSFCAAHSLPDLGPGHPCSVVHGHNYTVMLELRAEGLDGCMVRDYRELFVFKDWLDLHVDHTNLNESTPLGMPTAELLAAWFYAQAHALGLSVSAVRVSETPNTWAEYRPGGYPNE